MKRQQYGIFLPNGKWARATNKRAALRYARQHQGYVTAMADDNLTYDAPTFRVLSDIIADYRQPA